MDNLETRTGFWAQDVPDLLKKLDTRLDGLSTSQAQHRLAKRRALEKHPPRWKRTALLFLSQFRSPLILLLILGVVLSSILDGYSDALIIFVILLLSGVLSFFQEYNAGKSVEKLLDLVKIRSRVIRDGHVREIDRARIVPGDIVVLSAGDQIPGDCRILESEDLHVNESALTGESYPAEKKTGILAPDTPLKERTNMLYEGTSVINGTARALVVSSGSDSEFGRIAESLRVKPELTTFEIGINRFGFILMRIALVLAILILVINTYYGKPIADSILFALAVSLGIAPELLPAIITITMSAGARRLAKEKVIVKKLSSVESLGSIDVFCVDKTGTLTAGEMKVEAIVNVQGKENEKARLYAFLNSTFETGFSNPMDEAIREIENMSAGHYEKFDEVPYDFIRKRLSVVVKEGNKHIMITKGALSNILDVCTHGEYGEGAPVPLSEIKRDIMDKFQSYSNDGFRTIGLSYKDVSDDPVITKDDESDMIFLGFIVLADPIKPGIANTVQELKNRGITLKIITGDNTLVAAHVGRQLGIPGNKLLSGDKIEYSSNEALIHLVEHHNIFAEVEPMQKERLIKAMQKAGHAVAFMGDGINDAPALHTADVGISVNNAVAVAREAADIVLLEKKLQILVQGIDNGRKTFQNTLKYIYITTSANFGNIFSVVSAALILPFLPLLPIQILLINFLSDIPAFAIAYDAVDKDQLQKPVRWNIRFIRNFMLVFGIQSSIFDFLTFGLLYFYFKLPTAVFRTGWFTESMVTEVAILFIIRTRHFLFRSRPSFSLTILGLVTLGLTIVFPYMPFAHFFGLTPLPAEAVTGLVTICTIYIVSTEATKYFFFRRA